MQITPFTMNLAQRTAKLGFMSDKTNNNDELKRIVQQMTSRANPEGTNEDEPTTLRADEVDHGGRG
jgi:hypothetical protein